MESDNEELDDEEWGDELRLRRQRPNREHCP